MSVLLADAVLFLHALFVAGVVVPVLLIPVGAWAGWSFVRSDAFRNLHLAAIGFVVLESLIGMTCPLTVWENALRAEAGETGYANGFIADWTRRVLFHDWPDEVFTALYVGFGLLILGLYIAVPPRSLARRWGRRPA